MNQKWTRNGPEMNLFMSVLSRISYIRDSLTEQCEMGPAELYESYSESDSIASKSTTVSIGSSESDSNSKLKK